MKKRYIIIAIIAILILITPTIIYLCFLIPKMKEEYAVLMSSGGILAGGGMYAANFIPEKVKFSSIYKLSVRSFSIMVAITLVEKFMYQIIGLVATFIASYIIFKILMEVYKNGRRKKENRELAEEIARSVTKNSE